MALKLGFLKVPLPDKKALMSFKRKQREGDPYGWISTWAFVLALSLLILCITSAIGPAEYSIRDQTRLVVATQVIFYSYGYIDTLLSGDLRWTNAHLSAILDNDRRAMLGGLLTLFAGPAVVSLEASRPAPFWGCRVVLAVCVGFGILLTCLIRESGWFAGHVFAACLGFGSSFALVLICALCHAGSGWILLATGVLSVATLLTGSMQGLKLMGMCHFPSWALGLGEGVIVLCWGAAISQLSHV